MVTKIASVGLILWLLGFVWLGTHDGYDTNTRQLWLLLPIWAPLGVIAVLQIAIWLHEGYEHIIHRH